MKIQQLRYFAAVYEEGSFTTAAERVHSSQSGLSMQIKELEQRFDVVLLERTANGVHPTEIGHRFYEYATRILKEVAKAQHGMEALRGIVTGHVTVGLTPTLTRAIFPHALLKFMEKYPLLKISMLEAMSSLLVRDVLLGGLDFAIVPSTPNTLQAGLRGHTIGQDREFLVSRMGSDSKHMAPMNLEEKSGLKLILGRTRNYRLTNLLSYLKRNNIKVSALLELDSIVGTTELVEQSDWCTILPGAFCIPDVGGQGLCLNPLVDAPVIEYALIEEKSGTLSVGAQLFANAFKQEFEKQVQWSDL